ncbi:MULTISPECIES: HesA/MoeB/ThiF family protein [unclassified Moraxella]|uniref:HesA/MoeB/ThiF family protein n=1 Tax=unclassified Moraxella TaxID=2685852 RepID=UPI003AF8DD97
MQNPTQLTDGEMLRYARQILLDGWDIEAQTALKNSHVLIIGMGGLGCPLTETLCRAGVGQLTLIDDDVIDESNLQRQSLFTPNDIGQSKALIAKQRLNEINQFCQVEAFQDRLTANNYQELINFENKNSLSKLICDCTDNFKTRDYINQMAVKYRLPLLSASAIAQTGQLALFEAYLETGCYHCLFHGEGDDTRTCATSGVLASTTQIMGDLQAQVALTYLGLGKNSIAQTLLLWQGETMSLRKLKYKKDTKCEICGG